MAMAGLLVLVMVAEALEPMRGSQRRSEADMSSCYTLGKQQLMLTRSVEEPSAGLDKF